MQIKNNDTLKGVTLRQPSDNRVATAATLARMARLVRDNATDPQIITQARRIIDHVPGKDFRAEAEAIQNWVRHSIRYTRDVYHSETLQTPQVTLSERHGDCDDQAILVAALLSATGHPVRFRAIRAPGQGEKLAHVLAETRFGRGWVPVETTEPWPFGVYPAGIDLRGSMIRHV
jgi:transglutaminase-like putative cysteine protease